MQQKYVLIKKVVIENITPNATLKIFDITGKLLINNEIGGNSICETQLNEGVYVVCVNSSNGIARQKVIVQ